MKKKISITLIMILSLVTPVLNVSHAQVIKNAYSDSLLTLCKKNFNEGLYKKAVMLYNDADFEKLSAEELFYIGLSFNNLRETIKASQYFKKAVELASDHNGYKIQLARTLSQLGKTNEAIDNYQTIIKIDSNNVTALNEVGLLYFDSRDYEKAIEMFTRLVTINSNDFLSSYYLGYSMTLSQNPNLAEPAIKHLEHSVALNQEYLPAISLLASSKFNLQKYYDANALYSMAIKLRPLNADFYFRSGMCYERLNLYSEAANQYSKAVALDSNEANYFDHLGFVQYNMNNYASAVRAYKMAASLDDNPTYFINIGYTYAKMDSVKKSIESFQKALSLMPVDKIGNIYNQIGAVYYTKKNYKEAKAAYMKSLLYSPENIDAQFYIALINDKLMDWKNANLAYKKVIELAADDSLQTERVNFANKRIKELKRR
ncbi:MAG: tetratricopeptide repeat protein [Ignavibacteriales bacterium]|nr:tetratricopeptide repeat protein [Ignavibacteriales bacterium]